MLYRERPISFFFRIDFSEDEKLYISLQYISADQILCFAARTSGKGTFIHNTPKGWIIRRDPQDDAFIGQPKHYHCQKNGKEIVITHDGYGSHKTKSDTLIPKKLGEFLHEELGVDVKQNCQGSYIIRMIFSWPKQAYSNHVSVEILNDLFNNWHIDDAN